MTFTLNNKTIKQIKLNNLNFYLMLKIRETWNNNKNKKDIGAAYTILSQNR